jgi:superfamily II DNA or RNA helicase
MAAATLGSIPEPGQLVHVRQRQFVVTDVAAGSLPPDPLRGRPASDLHLVSLNCVADDGFGEELQVIWEIEPGARVIDRKSDLPAPAGFDTPRRLDAFLDAVRWGAAATADPRAIQSPFRSGIAIEDYQLDPVVRAVQMPRANLLIADDVGLGKTIETGLVLLELILRHRARTVLVVCPSALQIQWRDQMRDKFGLDFVIVDSKLFSELRRKRGLQVNPWTHYPRLITSIDFLKRDRPLRLFRDVLPSPGEPAFPRRFDVMVVDEAHNIAPSGRGSIQIDSQRTAAIRALAPHFEHKLFLSATPHNGYLDSFTALLELLDNQRFARSIKPAEEQLRTAVVRRLKTEIVDDWGRPRFARREIVPLEVDYAATEEGRIHALLRKYTQSRQGKARDAVERVATEFVLKLLKKRLFSSPAAFASTLEKHRSALMEAKRRTPGETRLSPTQLQREFDRVDEEFGDDEDYDQTTGETLETASRIFREPDQQERTLLDEMRRWADTARNRADAKANTLLSWLDKNIRPNGQWKDDRVILFTEYRDTQKWLFGLLTREGFGGERIAMLYGGMRPDEREAVKAAFQYDPQQSPVRILVATDAASEGIDLQNWCHLLIHHEIPWNPARLEQRNGRVDRHGQRAPVVLVHHFVGRGFKKDSEGVTKPGELEGDLEFLMRAAIKVNNIREDLGKVGPVIASQVEEAMLGHRATLDTVQAERDAEPARRMLKFERKVRDEVKRLRDQLSETRRDWRFEPANIQTVVETALELAGQPGLISVKLDGVKAPVFRLPEFRGTLAYAARGLEHPHTKQIRPVTFDHDAAAGRDDLVLIHLNHPLVQRSLALLRAEVWSQEGTRSLNRVAARVVPDHVLDTPAVVAYGRLVVIGGKGDRLHEEVITAGGRIREGKLEPKGLEEVRLWLDSTGSTEPPDSVKERFAAVWPNVSDRLRRELDNRAKAKVSSLDGKLDQRATEEKAKVRAILMELDRTIRAELDDPWWKQVSLFDQPELERRQLEDNVDSLRDRLIRIPGEIERETAAINMRFAGRQTHLFPVAVTWLLPARMAKEPVKG